jgi:Zn-dependent protease
MRLRLGSGFGIPIYLHWTFFLLPLWIVYTHPADSAVSVSVMLTLLPLLFVCVVLHEFGHALMARYFGIATQDVTLYPIGGVARLMRMTDKPLEEFLIAVAGPAVNVVIAVVLTTVGIVVAVFEPNLLFNASFADVPFAGKLLWGLWALNVIMVPFNMLPAFPMDGGRVLRALLSAWLGHYRGTQIAVGVGLGMAILIGLVGVEYFHNPMLAVIAVFVFFAGQQELLVARMREQQRKRWRDSEPLEVLPVWPQQSSQIFVYTWDNQTGTWRKEPGTLA